MEIWTRFAWWPARAPEWAPHRDPRGPRRAGRAGPGRVESPPRCGCPDGGVGRARSAPIDGRAFVVASVPFRRSAPAAGEHQDPRIVPASKPAADRVARAGRLQKPQPCRDEDVADSATVQDRGTARRPSAGRRGRRREATDLRRSRRGRPRSNGESALATAVATRALTAGRSSRAASSRRSVRTRLPLPLSSLSGIGQRRPVQEVQIHPLRIKRDRHDRFRRAVVWTKADDERVEGVVDHLGRARDLRAELRQSRARRLPDSRASTAP